MSLCMRLCVLKFFYAVCSLQCDYSPVCTEVLRENKMYDQSVKGRIADALCVAALYLIIT